MARQDWEGNHFRDHSRDEDIRLLSVHRALRRDMLRVGTTSMPAGLVGKW